MLGLSWNTREHPLNDQRHTWGLCEPPGGELSVARKNAWTSPPSHPPHPHCVGYLRYTWPLIFPHVLYSGSHTWQSHPSCCVNTDSENHQMTHSRSLLLHIQLQCNLFIFHWLIISLIISGFADLHRAPDWLFLPCCIFARLYCTSGFWELIKINSSTLAKSTLSCSNMHCILLHYLHI